MKTRRTKREITQYILDQLGNPISIESALSSWWQSFSASNQGLALSNKGLAAFKEAAIPFYTIKHPAPLKVSSRLLVDLQRYMTCPYFLNATNIKITGDTESMWLQMNGGDITEFIRNWK